MTSTQLPQKMRYRHQDKLIHLPQKESPKKKKKNTIKIEGKVAQHGREASGED